MGGTPLLPVNLAVNCCDDCAETWLMIEPFVSPPIVNNPVANIIAPKTFRAVVFGITIIF
jgi:hypothetical protein